MVRYMGHRRVQFIQSPLRQDEEEREEKKLEVRDQSEAAKIAFVANLDRTTMVAGPDHGVWFQAVGERPAAANPARDDDVVVTPEWLAAAASFSDFAVFLSTNADLLFDAARACRRACERRSVPTIFVGPFMDDAGSELDRFAGLADGCVIETPPREEPSLEAEALRRAAAGLGERMMVERATWTHAPSVCLSASADVLALVSPSVVEWALLGDAPSLRARPGGRLIVCEMPEFRPWWADTCCGVGPEVLGWRAWIRDPRMVRGLRA